MCFWVWDSQVPRLPCFQEQVGWGTWHKAVPYMLLYCTILHSAYLQRWSWDLEWKAVWWNWSGLWLWILQGACFITWKFTLVTRFAGFGGIAMGSACEFGKMHIVFHRIIHHQQFITWKFTLVTKSGVESRIGGIGKVHLSLLIWHNVFDFSPNDS